MTAAPKLRPRVFIVDFELVGYSGHCFNHAIGFREAARDLDLEARVYIPNMVNAEIVAELGARAILPFTRWRINKDIVLGTLADSHLMLRPLWDELHAENVSERDILIITSSRPEAIFGAGQWLSVLPEKARPAIFFRFFGPEFFDFQASVFTKIAWAHQFAARTLAGLPGSNRIFFTVSNRKAVTHLERLALRTTFLMPVPKYYGAVVDRLSGSTIEPAKIYIHANRHGDMPEQINAVVRRILKCRTDVTFLIRFCKHAYGNVAAETAIDKSLIGHGVKLLPVEQNHVEYLATLEEADMVLLPYDPIEYRGVVSGIFCEAAAMGKIAIVPAATWMADQVVEGHATGVLFSENSVSDLVEAIERAMEDRARLQAEALRRAGSFREQNSCARNLDRMIELAEQTHDMRLSHIPLTDITDVFGAQHYLGQGWSDIEDGFGVWSDGGGAELNFIIKPSAKALIFSAQVLPFLAAAHPRIDVSLTANNVPVAEWSFDAKGRNNLDWSWRHAQIPQGVTADDEIQLALRFSSPASPKELGLSNDARKLGLALRQFSLEPETPGQPFVEPVTSAKSSKMNLWRRWKWR